MVLNSYNRIIIVHEEEALPLMRWSLFTGLSFGNLCDRMDKRVAVRAGTLCGGNVG